MEREISLFLHLGGSLSPTEAPKESVTRNDTITVPAPDSKCKYAFVMEVKLAKFLIFTVTFLYPARICLLKVCNGKTRGIYDLCSKLSIETPEQVIEVVLVIVLLTLNIFHTFFLCFYCWL